MEPPPPMTTTTGESTETSPKNSQRTNSYDTSSSSSKLRLMCSYGGQIVPRPHDKTLCYVGGDTRIIVIDRHTTTLNDLSNRLSKSLLQNQGQLLFCLKYQLPNEDLDSLISVTTDEDLDNMIDEYDRLLNSSNKGGRIRLFLFPFKTSSSCSSSDIFNGGSVKSEDWFFNALNNNGKVGSTVSESSSVNCLLGLDNHNINTNNVDDLNFVKSSNSNSKDFVVSTAAETLKVGQIGNGNNANNSQDVQSVPGSPMLETSSSFGSTSSSPSVANLSPIRVHVVDDNNVNSNNNNPKLVVGGIEEQFQQLNVNLGQQQQLKQEEVAGFVANRVLSEDEHSLYRKVVQQQQPQQLLQPQMIMMHQQQQAHQQQQIAQFQQQRQLQQTGSATFDLASPDSATSEGSITNPLSRQRQPIYQEQQQQQQHITAQIQSGGTTTRVLNSTNQSDLLKPIPDQTTTTTATKIQMQQQQQLQESGYVLASPQYNQNHPQQQFVHAGTQYIPAMTSYYQVYPSQQQQHPHQQIMDQQYPVYFVPARQPPQGYNLPAQQPSYTDVSPGAPSARPQTPPSGMAPHPAFNQQINTPPSKPEMSSGVYRAAVAPQFVQGMSGPQQTQYVGYSQIHHPSQQSMAPSSAANPGYTYEFSDPTHAQMYYSQHLPPQMAAQYQTMVSAPMDASAQLTTENVKQQVRTLQP